MAVKIRLRRMGSKKAPFIALWLPIPARPETDNTLSR